MGMNLLIPYIMQKVSRECNSLRNVFNVTNKKRERKNFIISKECILFVAFAFSLTHILP